MEETRSEEGEVLAPEDSEVEILSIEAETEERPEPRRVAREVEAEAAGESAEVAVLRLELEELRDRALRTLADFDNYRKRVEREREEQRRQAVADVLRDLLPVVDNFDRALAAEAVPSDFRTGVELIARQLREVLGRFGLREVEAVGRPFDPRFHDAVSRQESAAVTEPTVAAELQRGYLLGDRLLRPAMVVVTVPAGTGGEGGSAAGEGA
ncbi:MAG: nucleotide exchange factor GrpE [Thermoanaerobaculia bacterium]|nr:nucleotide exchange factor GrpE [Thermoanaerobaculia bacterium]MCZ7650237.1 nucleotide exchange factor GrpE [Thermoanaerobaculia bacterium]